MIDRDVNLEDYHFVNDGIFQRLKYIQWWTVCLEVNFGGVFVGFVGYDLVGNGESNSFRNYWDNNLEWSKFVGSKVPKISQMKADINGSLYGVLIEVQLELLHFGWDLMISNGAKNKNCFLIIHHIVLFYFLITSLLSLKIDTHKINI